MKKIAIIGVAMGLLIIPTVLFWHRQNHPTDLVMRQRLLGEWVPNIADGRSRTFAMSADGHWTEQITGKIGTGKMDGTWLVKDGLLIWTMTNNDLDMQVPLTDTARIIRIDSHEFVVQNGNTQLVYKKIEP
jgi:hypothetical protein